MFKYFKQFLSDIKIVADCHKLYQDYKGYFLSIFLSITSISGWYIMIQEILGAILISTPIIYLIYLTKQIYNVKNKLMLFDSKLRIVDNQYLDFALCVDNLANQVIECAIDFDKSSSSVNGVSLAKEKMRLYRNTLYPFAIHQIWIQIMDIDKLSINNEFEISLKIHLNYGTFLQSLKHVISFQFNGIFIIKIDDEGNKEISLIREILPASPINP